MTPGAPDLYYAPGSGWNLPGADRTLGIEVLPSMPLAGPHLAAIMGEPDIRSTVEFRVRYAETDQMGVVYHANYLVWCEVGRTELIRMLGTSYAALEKDGVLLAVSDASLRFHAPARYDDTVVVETRLEELRSRSITFSYLISRGEGGFARRLVSARTTLIALDPAGRTRSMPASLLRLFDRKAPSPDA